MSTLSDLYAYWGQDLTASNTGDLLTVTGTERGKQRVLRRLLTNPSDYVFENYGAGLPQFIGEPVDVPKLTALVQSQIALEPVVAPTPAPVVTIAQLASDQNGFSVGVAYTDSDTGEPVVLSFEVSN